jgi:PAS domain S-box-containing protein
MNDGRKTKKQLLNELVRLRKHVTKIKTIEHEYVEKEKVFQESVEKFRLVFENAFDGISIFEEFEDPSDPENRRLVDCNARYAEMAGRSREELIKMGRTRGLAKSITPNNLQSIINGVIFRGMFSWLRPDGKDNIIEYTAVPITIQGKKFTIGIDRDITERVRMEEALRRAQTGLEQRVEERTSELVDANARLKEEIAERKRAEAEREQLITELQSALADVKTLSGLIPICAHCKKIRNDQGYWTQLEAFIQDRSNAEFTHGICPDCVEKLYPDYNKKK